MSILVTNNWSLVTGTSKPRAFFAFTVLILAALACGGGSNIPPTLVIEIPTPDADRIATLDLVENDVNARESAAEDMSPAIKGQRLNNDGQVQTLAAGRAHVLFTEGTLIRISENTLLSLADMNTNPDEPVARFFLEIGKIWLVLQSGTVEVETPIGVATVRGSFESVEYYPGNLDDPNDDHMIVTCLEGDCQRKVEMSPFVPSRDVPPREVRGTYWSQ